MATIQSITLHSVSTAALLAIFACGYDDLGTKGSGERTDAIAILNTSLVPVMTSDTTPTGNVTRSGVYYPSYYEAWKAFDGTSSGMWMSNTFTSSVWIAYEWGGGAAVRVDSYRISYTDGGCCEERGPRDWTLEGWDGSDWVVVDTVHDQTDWSSSHIRTYVVDTPGSYFKYRLSITADNYYDPDYPITLVSIAQLDMYGCTSDCDLPQDPQFQETVLQEGDAWKLISMSGSASDPATGQPSSFNESFWVVRQSGIESVPLSSFMKDELASHPDDPNDVVMLSAAIVNGIDTSIAQGALTPELAAIAEPLDEQAPDEDILALSRSCSDRSIHQSRNFTANTPFNFSTNPGSGFSGTLSGAGNIQANATGEILTVLRRTRVLFWCIPYGVKSVHVRAFGTGAVAHNSTITGVASYSNAWNWEIAKVPLFSLNFFAGPIPVHIGFNLPINVGLDLQATATGTVTYTGSQGATGSFDYTCTPSGCSGSSAFTQTNPVSPQIGTASVSGRIQPDVWAQAGFRGYLYSEWFGYAQVGVRPSLRGDIWGYYGNNCGDANADGVFETVDALTLDLDLQVHVTGKAGTFGATRAQWGDIWHTPRYHLGFWDLIGSDALQPMFDGSSTAMLGVWQAYGARMRPCWPYPDTVTYRFGWGDGTANNVSGAPQTTATASHAWTSAGTRTAALTALNDSHGRSTNQTTSRVITVGGGGGTWTGWLDRDNPGGMGDYETRADFGAQVPCSAPIAIECQTTGGVDYTRTGEVYSCTPSVGGFCVNANQPDRSCLDYRVRFRCP